jgi:hypothetical protein
MRRLTAGLVRLHVGDPGGCQSRQGDQTNFLERHLLEQPAGLRARALQRPKPDAQAVERTFFQQGVSLSTTGGLEDQTAFDGQALGGLSDVEPTPDRGSDVVHPQEQGHAPLGLVLGQ